MKPQSKKNIITNEWIERLRDIYLNPNDEQKSEVEYLRLAQLIEYWVSKIPAAPFKETENWLLEYQSNLPRNGGAREVFQAEKEHIAERMTQTANFMHQLVCETTKQSINNLLDELDSGKFLASDRFYFDFFFKVGFQNTGLFVLSPMYAHEQYTSMVNYYFRNENYRFQIEDANKDKDGRVKSRIAILHEKLVEYAPEHLKGFVANLPKRVVALMVYNSLGKAAEMFALYETEYINKLTKKSLKTWDELNPKILNDAELKAKKQKEQIKNFLTEINSYNEANFSLQNSLNTKPIRVGFDFSSNAAFGAEYKETLGLKESHVVILGKLTANSKRQKQFSEKRLSDALFDLSYVLGVTPNRMSLNNLSISYGSETRDIKRNQTSLAYYTEHDNNIHLKGGAGEGSLAHEWIHAFDFHLEKLFCQAATERNLAHEYQNVRLSITNSQLPVPASDLIAALLKIEKNAQKAERADAQPCLDILNMAREVAPEWVGVVKKLIAFDEVPPQGESKPSQQQELVKQLAEKLFLSDNRTESVTKQSNAFVRTINDELVESLRCALLNHREPSKFAHIILGFAQLGGLETQHLNENSIEVIQAMYAYNEEKIKDCVLKGAQMAFDVLKESKVTKDIRAVIETTIKDWLETKQQYAKECCALNEQDLIYALEKQGNYQSLGLINLFSDMRDSVNMRLSSNNTDETKLELTSVLQQLSHNLFTSLKATLPDNMAFMAHVYQDQFLKKFSFNVASLFNSPATQEQVEQFLHLTEKSHPEILAKNLSILDAINQKNKPTTFLSAYQYAQSLDKKSGKEYWARPTELLARVGEAIIGDWLQDKGFASPFLCHASHDAQSGSILYASKSERQSIARNFKAAFQRTLGNFEQEWFLSVKDMNLAAELQDVDNKVFTPLEVPNNTIRLNQEWRNTLLIQAKNLEVQNTKDKPAVAHTNELKQRVVNFDRSNQLSFGF